jgi:hypothetical protein
MQAKKNNKKNVNSVPDSEVEDDFKCEDISLDEKRPLATDPRAASDCEVNTNGHEGVQFEKLTVTSLTIDQPTAKCTRGKNVLDQDKAWKKKFSVEQESPLKPKMPPLKNGYLQLRFAPESRSLATTKMSVSHKMDWLEEAAEDSSRLRDSLVVTIEKWVKAVGAWDPDPLSKVKCKSPLPLATKIRPTGKQFAKFEDVSLTIQLIQESN